MITLKFKSKRIVQSNWPIVPTGNTPLQKAIKLGISLQEYERRSKLVSEAWVENKWRVGDIGYPFNKANYEEHGSCRVVGIVSNYDQYGSVEWNEAPYILSVRPDNDPNTTVNCTHGWLIASPKYIISGVC